MGQIIILPPSVRANFKKWEQREGKKKFARKKKTKKKTYNRTKPESPMHVIKNLNKEGMKYFGWFPVQKARTLPNTAILPALHVLSPSESGGSVNLG